jgi:hypothetical protein
MLFAAIDPVEFSGMRLGGPTMRHAKHALKPVKTALHDEEISDVTLATFHVFDKDASGARELAAGGRRGRALGGGCGGCGCGHGSTAW